MPRKALCPPEAPCSGVYGTGDRLRPFLLGLGPFNFRPCPMAGLFLFRIRIPPGPGGPPSVIRSDPLQWVPEHLEWGPDQPWRWLRRAGGVGTVWGEGKERHASQDCGTKASVFCLRIMGHAWTTAPLKPSILHEWQHS